MQLHSLTMRNFRCFKNKTIHFNAQQIIIIGKNGSGKTSIIEALYFLCFFKSFRTAQISDLALYEQDDEENLQQLTNINIDKTYNNATFSSTETDMKNNFFIALRAHNETDIPYEISVGVHNNKKQILCNNKKPTSRRDIFLDFPLFSITEDDLQLIKGDPEYRRTFVDQAISFSDKQFITTLKALKAALIQRNALLMQINKQEEMNHQAASLLRDPSELHKSLKSWTHLVWQKSIEVEEARVGFIKILEKKIKALLDSTFENEGLCVTIDYTEKKPYIKNDFERFWLAHSKIIPAEIALKRSLFGAHLDDIIISFKSKKAKNFASRGQQKLIVFLIKFSQYLHIKEQCKQKGILLLDDFITDFDSNNLNKALEIINKENLQTIITCPHHPSHYFTKNNDQQIILLDQENNIKIPLKNKNI